MNGKCHGVAGTREPAATRAAPEGFNLDCNA
jgi:hypothetical protein